MAMPLLRALIFAAPVKKDIPSKKNWPADFQRRMMRFLYYM